MNIIWNAAADHSLRSDFMAFLPDGRSDFYFNMVIGLAAKWFDRDRLSVFFSSYAGEAGAEDLDALMWLAIENAVYEKELPRRPVLGELRKRHADMFFLNKGLLPSREMMAQDRRVQLQQEARWASVSGRPLPTMGPRARELSGALLIPGTVDSAELVKRLQDILIVYMKVRSFRIGGSRRSGGPPGHPFRREVRHVDSLIVRDRGASRASDLHAQSLFTRQVAERSGEDRGYIFETFGPCVYSENDMRILENDLCRDDHGQCRLWISEGGGVSARHGDRLGRRAAEDARAQNEKNEAFFEKNRELMTASIKSLSAQLETIFSSFAKPLPVRSRRGVLDTARAYRIPVLDDPCVFTRPGDEVEYDISVDLLLDASASRLDDQEMIAAQSYVIAMSLEKCGIPVQVMSFRSLRGYTVLQILKRYADEKGRGIFRYFAGGWNRDGLAIRAAGREMRRSGEDVHRIMLVMTDAHPNDSTPLPPEEGSILRREYDGPAAVEDTVQAVKAMRSEGVNVAAVYLGIAGNLGNLHTIYGREYVRVARIGELAAGISSLVQMTLREMKN